MLLYDILSSSDKQYFTISIAHLKKIIYGYTRTLKIVILINNIHRLYLIY